MTMTRATSTQQELERVFAQLTVLRRGTGAPGAPWRTTAPADVGFAPDLADRLAAAAAATPGLHALVVARGGRLVLEHYRTGVDFSWGLPYGEVEFGPRTLHDIRSVTKSIVALLYGIALADGQVPDPAAPLLAGLPEHADLAPDPARARLTVGHALTMTLGLEWNEDIPYTDPANGEIAMILAPDRWRFVLERPVVEAPGARWSYCGGAAELLGRLIAAGTGMGLPEYAHTRLFAPLGIGAFEWLAGADQVAAAASGLRLAPRDLARIGQLVLDRGRWHGRTIVPADWLAAALAPRVETSWGMHYGYQWYQGGAGQDRWVGGIGNGEQRLLVFPARDLVVVMATGRYEINDGTLTQALVHDLILPGLSAAGAPRAVR